MLTFALLVASVAPLSSAAPTDPDQLLVEQMLRSAQWQQDDPTWPQSTRHKVSTHRFGPRRVIRVTPYLKSPYGELPVEGADRVISIDVNGSRQVLPSPRLRPLGEFRYGEHDAVLQAARSVGASVINANNVAQTKNLGRRIWLHVGAGQRAAWRVRVPTLHPADMRDVWIDAQTGLVLRSRPVAKFVAARRGGQ